MEPGRRRSARELGPEDILAAYEERINRHDFDLLAPLIAADATFWFTEGSYSGHAEIRAAFERTWGALNNDIYRLDDRRWVAIGDDVAACSYRFSWTTTVDGRLVSGRGRGTTVLRRDAGQWLIAHEQLSADP
jgi:ketosteroid isomerase-like protein